MPCSYTVGIAVVIALMVLWALWQQREGYDDFNRCASLARGVDDVERDIFERVVHFRSGGDEFEADWLSFVLGDDPRQRDDPRIEGMTNRAPVDWTIEEYPIVTTNDVDMSPLFPQSSRTLDIDPNLLETLYGCKV
jgi:hypothetical protein